MPMSRFTFILALMTSSLFCQGQDVNCYDLLAELKHQIRVDNMDSAIVIMTLMQWNCAGYLKENDSLQAEYFICRVSPPYLTGDNKTALAYCDSALMIIEKDIEKYSRPLFEVYKHKMRLYSQAGQNDLLMNTIEEARKNLDKYFLNDKIFRIGIQTEMALYSGRYPGKQDTTISLIAHALEVYENEFGRNSAEWLSMAVKYISVLWYARKYDDIENICIDIIEVNNSMGQSISQSLEAAYYYLGQVSESQSDYYQAIQFYKKHAAISKHLGYTMYELAQYSIAKSYYTLNNFSAAQPYFEEIVNHTPLTAVDNYRTRMSLPKLAVCVGLGGDTVRMNKLFEQIESYYEGQQFWLGTIADEKAKFFFRDKQYPKAIEALTQGINRWSAMGGPTFQHLSKRYISRAEASIAINNYSDVLLDCALAKKCIGYSSDKRNYSDAHNLAELLQILRLESNVYRNQATGVNRDSLFQLALEKYDETLNALDYVRFGFKEQQSHNYLNHENFEVFDDAISLMMSKEDNGVQIFDLIERSKDMYLLEAISSGSLRESDRLSEYEKIKSEILKLEQQLEFDRSLEGDSLNAKRVRLNDLRLQHNKLYQELTKQQDKAFQLRFDTSLATINTVQGRLKRNEALLNFFAGKQRIIGVLVLKDEFQNFIVDISYKEQDALTKAIQSLQSPNFNESSEAVGSISNIAKELFEPVLAGLIEHKVSHLYISPDGWTTQVPFELIQIDDAYLIDKVNCTYVFSASQFVHTNGHKHNHRFVGIAPDYALTDTSTENSWYADLVRSGQWALPHAKEEVKYIHKILGGNILLGKSVTKSTFINVLEDHGIIHYSGHALLDAQYPSYSRLVLPPFDSIEASLTVAEIYNLNIPSYLTTLSACNTASGSYEKGNGVNSLARAFHFAGSDATIVSLWPVPDESTKDIMQFFYGHIKDGKKKSEALRQAKLDYLNNVSAQAQRNPVYWAGFILIGQDGVIPTENRSWIYVAIGFLLVFMILALAYRTKYARRKR